MKKPWVDPDAPAPEPKTGSYPPDVARMRRRYGLPVTPAEHAAYDRGETIEPPVTKAQMVKTLRAVAPSASPVLRAAMLEVADRIARGKDVSPTLSRQLGPLGQAVQAVIEREPGEDG